MPDPAEWIAVVIKENDVDVVLDSEFDCVGRDRC